MKDLKEQYFLLAMAILSLWLTIRAFTIDWKVALIMLIGHSIDVAVKKRRK